MGVFSVAAVLLALLQCHRSFNRGSRSARLLETKTSSSPIDKLFRGRNGGGGHDEVGSSGKKEEVLRAMEARRERRMAGSDPSALLQRVSRPKLPPLPRLEGDATGVSYGNDSSLAVKPNRRNDEEDLDAKVLFPEMAQAGLDEKVTDRLTRHTALPYTCCDRC